MTVACFVPIIICIADIFPILRVTFPLFINGIILFILKLADFQIDIGFVLIETLPNFFNFLCRICGWRNHFRHHSIIVVKLSFVRFNLLVNAHIIHLHLIFNPCVGMFFVVWKCGFTRLFFFFPNFLLRRENLLLNFFHNLAVITELLHQFIPKP